MARSFPGLAVGAYDDLGGVITIQWVPDPKVVADRILQLAGYLENTTPPLMAAKAIAQADMRARFETETDPEGNAWAPLDPEYEVRKQSEGSDPGILKRWGELEQTATAGNAYIVAGGDLFYNTSDLPFYWAFHESGSGVENVGSHANMRATTRALRGAGMADTGGTHESLGIGRGQALPRRPFIGISAEAEAQIFEVFDLWFAEGVSINIAPSGTVQERAVSGRFGKKLYPDFGALIGQ